jgi:hypothetical protein
MTGQYNMYIMSSLFLLARWLNHEFAWTQHVQNFLRFLGLLHLPRCRAYLNSVNKEATGVELIEVVISLSLGRGLED